MKDKKYHKSVLLKESIDCLEIKGNGFYVDGTAGEGGHSFKIFNNLTKEGLLLSIDQDQEAVNFIKRYYNTDQYSNWIVEKANFIQIPNITRKFRRKIDGIILDLGFSSRQLEYTKRGFSYQEQEEPLDMRMDTKSNVKAIDIIRVSNQKQLASILQEFGETRSAHKIATEIHKHKHEIDTVGDLLNVVSRVLPTTRQQRWTAIRKVFQALRIAVNSELTNLEQFLQNIYPSLNKNAIIAIVTFHSLEDRIVKHTFRDWEQKGLGKAHRFIKPTEKELKNNLRAHSAKLRCFKTKN